MNELFDALVKAQGGGVSNSESKALRALVRAKKTKGVNQHSAQPMPNRFFEKIAYGRSDCWTWVGAVETGGYGYFPFENEKKAHRVSYVLFSKKPIPAKKMVLHSCDNPLCVNPAHLSVGTQQDNINDAIRKGRFNHNRKLTAAQVAIIKHDLATSEYITTVARKHGLKYCTVRSIAMGRTWADLSLHHQPARDGDRGRNDVEVRG